MQVSSEETVLFTAQSYTDKLMRSSSQQHAVDKLAPLVRCPHLSQFWLSASVLSRDADKPLLCGLQPAGAPQLKRLLLLKQAHKVDACLTAAVITQYVPCAPDSWLLPVRDIQPAVSSRELEWTLDVAAIRQAAKDSADQKQTSVRWSPTSCLLGGVKWSMKLEWVWDASKQGSRMGLYATARNLPTGIFCCCTYSLECVGADVVTKGTGVEKLFSESGWGFVD
jgi:hypothetical protein